MLRGAAHEPVQWGRRIADMTGAAIGGVVKGLVAPIVGVGTGAAVGAGMGRAVYDALRRIIAGPVQN